MAELQNARGEAEKWKPVRHGAFYGSPRCCGGTLCTWAAFERATKEADALARRMGDGWEPVVWENLGWHYEVRKGCCTVSPTVTGGATDAKWKIDGYRAHFDNITQITAYAEMPENALGFATQDARTMARRIVDDLGVLLS